MEGRRKREGMEVERERDRSLRVSPGIFLRWRRDETEVIMRE